ncbi:MAG: hypothetical protein LBC56_05295 [Oscillospiraceae bacterium]|jgi:hypothetical protein|nr:hypothetical protein [Oscillospiraceae bacterium]
MKFYNNRPPHEKDLSPETLGYKKSRGINNFFAKLITALCCAFGLMCLSFLVSEYIFGLPVRTSYSLREFSLSVIIKTLAIMVISRIALRRAFTPRGPFSKKAVYGYLANPPKIFAFYDGDMSKLWKLVQIIAPLVLINLFCLFSLKYNFFGRRGNGYYIPFYLLYLNSAFSALDIYDFFLALFRPAGSVFRDWGGALYYMRKDSFDRSLYK